MGYIRQRVQEVDVFGGTAFYDAVLEGLERVSKLSSSMSKWVIALTDGADGHSKKDKGGNIGSKAEHLLKTIPNVNICVITVGSLPEETISVVTKYVRAAEASGGKGLHIVASDAAKIAEAFTAIGNLMAEDA